MPDSFELPIDFGCFVREMFEIIHDEAGVPGDGAAWRYRPGPAINETAWLRSGIICDARGRRFEPEY